MCSSIAVRCTRGPLTTVRYVCSGWTVGFMLGTSVYMFVKYEGKPHTLGMSSLKGHTYRGNVYCLHKPFNMKAK